MQVHPLEHTLSVVGPVVGGVITLALFFYLMAWLTGDSEARARRVGIKRVLDDRTRATVHLVNGTVFENVRFVGYTDSTSIKGGLPHELHGMVILEHPDGRRTLIQAKLVRMIEVPGPAA